MDRRREEENENKREKRWEERKNELNNGDGERRDARGREESRLLSQRRRRSTQSPLLSPARWWTRRSCPPARCTLSGGRSAPRVVVSPPNPRTALSNAPRNGPRAPRRGRTRTPRGTTPVCRAPQRRRPPDHGAGHPGARERRSTRVAVDRRRVRPDAGSWACRRARARSQFADDFNNLPSSTAPPRSRRRDQEGFVTVWDLDLRRPVLAFRAHEAAVLNLSVQAPDIVVSCVEFPRGGSSLWTKREGGPAALLSTRRPAQSRPRRRGGRLEAHGRLDANHRPP